jgi:ABC-type branched-subunit amino acid transport system substrate-binding protein
VPTTIRRTNVAVLLLALLSACETAAPAATDPSSSPTSPTPAEPTASAPAPVSELKVAYIRDLSPEGALAATSPAEQALELSFATATLQQDGSPPIEVVPVDTQGDPALAAESARAIAADPAFVAAVAGPGLTGQETIASILGVAEVPLLSLSAHGSATGAPPGTWLRLVAPVQAEAVALASTSTGLKAARLGICVVAVPTTGSAFGPAAERILVRETGATEVTDVAGVEDAGCGVVVWTGDAAGAARFATALAGLDAAPRLVGGVALREPIFLEEAGPAAEGARSICSCTDVSTSLALAAQRFIQDFQSEHGSSPGPFAVEAWDAAHLLLRGLGESGGSPAELAGWLAAVSAFDGLVGRYVLRDGELADPTASMRVSRVDGGRWVPEP